MVTLDKALYTRFIAKAKDEGITVRGSIKTRTFSVPSASGNGVYRVVVASGIHPRTGECNCPAGQNDKACKHLAACCGAVSKAQLSAAAKVMRQAQ